MSDKSDKYEQDVAKNINSFVKMIDSKNSAERPRVGTDYADVKVIYNKKESWIEVKMNHKDNLGNPRVFYDMGWKTTYKTPIAQIVVNELNKSSNAKLFIHNIAAFAKKDHLRIQIPTTKGGLTNENAVPLDVMKKYFNTPGINRYIMFVENYDIGNLVVQHYTVGKTKPAFYIQTGDDFYMLTRNNPLGFNINIPLFKGKGTLKVRVATRSDFYEVQAEIKIDHLNPSNFSFKPGSKKMLPFNKNDLDIINFVAGK